LTANYISLHFETFCRNNVFSASDSLRASVLHPPDLSLKILMAKQKVRILNPAPGGSNITSVNRAQRYVHLGHAEFVGPFVIRFLDTPMQRSVVARANETLLRRFLEQSSSSL